MSHRTARICAAAWLCIVATTGHARDDGLLRHLPDGARAPREVETPEALRTVIATRSADLFDAIFVRCAPDEAGRIVTADFEFHHDRWGTIATSRERFAERLRGQCERQRRGERGGSRRELVAGTQEVFPMGEDGALETGIHRFHAVDAHGGETLVGIARYSHLWHREGDAWRVARILSYDHRDVR